MTPLKRGVVFLCSNIYYINRRNDNQILNLDAEKRGKSWKTWIM